jgi:hypothetical protein
MTEVTYKDFSRLAKKRSWTVYMLVELFKGKTGIEDRSDKYHEPLASYFERVLFCQWLNPETKRMEDRSRILIAYRSIIEFYLKELSYETNKDIKPQAGASVFGRRACACGCGEAVFDRKKWARPGCKKRLQRSLSVTAKTEAFGA